MKKLFGVALLALPFLTVSAQAEGYPFNVQAGGSFYLKGGPGCSPQAGPWYLYWPLEAHFVAPAPTGYPYWPGPQVLPQVAIGGPAVPPAYAPPVVVPAPAAVAPAPQAAPKIAVPPYLQPTSYYATPYNGQAPSYWYDR
jgi:hypothetical protein